MLWAADAESLASMALYTEGDNDNYFTAETAQAELAAATAQLESDGHYLSGMVQYEGEWYWGIDRLQYLERRLLALPDTMKVEAVAGEAVASGRDITRVDSLVLFAKTYQLSFLGRGATKGTRPASHKLELFYSPRSPVL